MSLLGSPYRPSSLPVSSRNAVGLAAIILDVPQLHLTHAGRKCSKRSIHHQRKDKRPVTFSANAFEDLFVRSLVIASSCPGHSIPRRPSVTSISRSANTASAHINPVIGQSRKHYSYRARGKQSERDDRDQEEERDEQPEEELQEAREKFQFGAKRAAIAKEEYRDLVNIYDPPPALWDKPRWDRPKHPRDYYPLAPRLVVSAEDEARGGPREILPPEDNAHAQELEEFASRLSAETGSVDLPSLWIQYNSLRSPRLRYLPDKRIRRFFRHLTCVEFKHEEGAMERYMELLNQCTEEGVPVTAQEWNSAISFSGRCMRDITTKEVKNAIEMWMRMERSGNAATNVTFNILFHLAIKAGRYALADTIYKELQQREMPIDSHFRTNMIYYAGVRSDGDAVRQAFRDLVNAGEIVNTTVMNCVIASLIRAGEATSAESVFEKMKRLHEQKLGTVGPENWRQKRKIGRQLNKLGQLLRQRRDAHASSFFGTESSFDDQREALQRASPIAPNSHTYRILIQHHTITSGDLDSVLRMLAEMKERNFNIHGSSYIQIFRGFWKHGGLPGTAWTLNVLQSMWDSFLEGCTSGIALAETKELQSVEESQPVTGEYEQPPYFTRMAALGIIDAFYKCGNRKKMLDVWSQIKAAWKDMADEDQMLIQERIDKHVKEDAIHRI